MVSSQFLSGDAHPFVGTESYDLIETAYGAAHSGLSIVFGWDTQYQPSLLVYWALQWNQPSYFE